MSLAVLPSIRKKPRLEWRMASETARLAALVASLPLTSTPMPISVIQRTRAMEFPLFRWRRDFCPLFQSSLAATTSSCDAGLRSSGLTSPSTALLCLSGSAEPIRTFVAYFAHGESDVARVDQDQG